MRGSCYNANLPMIALIVTYCTEELIIPNFKLKYVT